MEPETLTDKVMKKLKTRLEPIVARPWRRIRFHANFPDSRPMIWPPLGPWWQTGFAGDESYATVVAYFPADQADQLLKYWPEATEVDVQCRDGITFTDRFACPDYWDEANCCVKPEVAAQYPTTALVSGDTQ